MRKPSAPLVISTLALIIAVGSGTAYAANTLAKNSVGTPQLKKNAVTSEKVKDGTLAERDLSADAVTSLKGATGPTGPQGVQGTQGPQGEQGIQGPAGADGRLGVLEMTYGSFAWDTNNRNTHLAYGFGYVSVINTSPQLVSMALSGPLSAAGTAYRLSRLEYCTQNGSGSASVGGVILYYKDTNKVVRSISVTPPSNSSATGFCHKFPVSTSAGDRGFVLELTVTGTGTVALNDVWAEWTPVS